MKVITHWCNNNTFRLTPPCGTRVVIRDYDGSTRWDRSIATRALDALEVELGVDRKNVRFDHY